MSTLITATPVQGTNLHKRPIQRLGLLFLTAILVATFALSGCGGGSGGGASTMNVQPTDGQPADGQPTGTGTATLAWTAPTTNADGTPLTTLAGYKVYYGTKSGVYTSIVVGNVSSYEIAGLANGQKYYFTVTAYDTHGIESDYAPEASKLVS